MLIATIK